MTPGLSIAPNSTSWASHRTSGNSGQKVHLIAVDDMVCRMLHFFFLFPSPPVLSSLLSRPTPALQQSVAELKNVTSFDDSKYKLRVCMHLRVGVDAGEEFEVRCPPCLCLVFPNILVSHAHTRTHTHVRTRIIPQPMSFSGVRLNTTAPIVARKLLFGSGEDNTTQLPKRLCFMWPVTIHHSGAMSPTS